MSSRLRVRRAEGGSPWRLLCLAGLLAVSACGSDGDGAVPPRNVVLVSIDTCRPDRLSCYGYPRTTTPNLDALAQEGVLFTQARSTNSMTLPAHASLLTGTIPPVHGVHSNEVHGLSASNETLAELLSEAGLRTAAFVGAFPLDSRFGLDQGFETYDDHFLERAGAMFFNERPAEDVSRAALSWLDEHHAEPFFLFLHYFDPHAPHEPPEPFASRHSDEPYAGEIAYVDSWIGKLLERLEALGVADSTVVIVTADHGESLGEHGEATHGYFVYDSTIRVPLIVKAPGGVAGRRVDEPVGLIDVTPTVLGLVGKRAPAGLDGIDLTPWLRDESPSSVARAMYSESLAPAAYGSAPIYGLVQDSRHFLWTARPELYDLERDPREERDQVGDDGPRAERMRERIEAVLAEAALAQPTGEPRTDGAATSKRLESLGYAGGAGVTELLEISPGMEDPKDFLPLYMRLQEAHGHFGEGAYAPARALYEGLVAERPALLYARYMLARIELAEGRLEPAIAGFTHVVETGGDPSAPAATREGSFLVGLAAFELSAAYEDAGRPAEAEASLREAIARMPDSRAAPLNLAGLLERQGRQGEARRTYEALLAVAPDDADARYRLGLLLARAGNAVQARSCFERAIAARPGFVAAHMDLSVLYHQQHQRPKAIEAYNATLALDPELVPALHGLGVLMAEEGRFDEAVVLFERAVRADPEFAPARRNLERARRSAAAGGR